MGLKRTDEFRKDAVRIALTSGLKRGGSACLNSFEPFLKWISCSATPRPGLVAA
jgi:hypothetical protein